MSKLYIEFDAPVQQTVPIESCDFLCSDLVVVIHDYVAEQLGVEAHTVKLRAQHTRHWAWFMLALHETLGDIRDYHVSITKPGDDSAPAHKLRIKLEDNSGGVERA